jgi:hypothetical protein
VGCFQVDGDRARRWRSAACRRRSAAQLYTEFATAEARGESACYLAWAQGVAADPELLGLLAELPEPKRQPNLLFAAARYTGIGPGPYADFRAAVLGSWPQVRSLMIMRRTQTNEAARCAPLLPLLAALPQPLALLEVGASAGLCLYPDRFGYRYGNLPLLAPADRPAATVISCAIEGPVPVPSALPEVVWRAGIDLNPLDVSNPADMRWLETLVWPEQHDRRQRLAAAIAVARADPPYLVAGDLNDKVTQVAALAPDDATLVIFHTSVLGYLDAAGRSAFTAAVRDLPGYWISNEIPSAIAFESLPPSPDPSRLLSVLAQDGRPVAYTGTHGQDLHWFA